MKNARKIWMFLVSIGVLLESCVANEPKSRTDSIELKILKVDNSVISYGLTNTGKHPVYLWDDANSYGWDALSIDVRIDNEVISIKRKQADFTRNGPGRVSVEPDNTIKRDINLGDGYWEIPQKLRGRNGEFEIRLKLAFQKTKDAKKFQILETPLESDWRKSFIAIGK